MNTPANSSITNHPHHLSHGHGHGHGHGPMPNLDVNNSMGHTANYNSYNDCSVIGRNNSLGGCSSDDGNSCDFNLSAGHGHSQQTQNAFAPGHMMNHHTNGSNDNLHPSHGHGQMHHQGQQQSMHPHHLPPVHSMHQSINPYANSVKIEPLDGNVLGFWV